MRRANKDRKERKHRRTWAHPEAVEFMASAHFDDVPSLAEAMGLEDRPANFVAEINGHQIYRKPAACFTSRRGLAGEFL